MGLCAAQCARLLGAGKVVLVEPRQERRALALQERLADEVIDPYTQDAPAFMRSLTQGRGADSVIEAAGAADTFQLAWQLARPNAVVSVVAMYEQDQVLPLPRMYGKNLIFKTGGVDANCCPQLVDLIAHKKLRTDFLITHRAPLEKILDGYKIFSSHTDGCLKWVITNSCQTDKNVP